MAVLQAVGESATALALVEIARLSGLPVGTAHRYVHELAELGSLERLEDGRYVIGEAMWRLGMATRRERVIRRAAGQILERLTAATSLTSAVGLFADDQLVSVDNRPGRWREVRMLQLGAAVPILESSAGRLLLAGLPDGELADRFPGLDVRSKPRLVTEMASVRSSRYAIREGAVFPDQTSLSVPVARAPGTGDMVMTLIAPRGIVDAMRYLGELRRAAAALATRLATAPRTDI
jgi:DNA-binding IclR family transcriptional regulator